MRSHPRARRSSPPRHSSSWRGSTAPSSPGGASSWRRAWCGRRRSTRGARPTSCPRRRTSARTDWKVAPAPPDLQDRRVEITGPVDRKMVINALNSGANVFMADFEDSQLAHLGATSSRARSTCATPSAATIALHQPRGQGSTSSTTRSRPCWCGRAAGTWRRSTCWSTASRSRASLFDFGAVLLPQRRRPCWRKGTRPVLLPAEDGEPPRGAPVERRLRAARRTTLGRAAGHDPGHGADRDASWPPSRWTRSSTSCASTRPG